MKTLVLFVTLAALAGCIAPLPTRIVYVPYVPPQSTAQQAPATQAYVAPQGTVQPVYPVYQAPMYQMYPRNPGYCPGPWCPQQQFGYGGGYGGYGRGNYFFYHRHGGRW